MTSTETNPVTQTLIDTLQDKVLAAFEAVGYEAKFGGVRVSDRPDIADFQCNGLMGVAKSRKMNPMEAGGAVLEALELDGLFEAEVVKPGFLNFRATDAALVGLVAASVADARSLAGKVDARKIMVDYGGPNLAKEMHVGHLRSAIVGHGLINMLKFAGHDVVSDVHLGDWGLQLGQLITQIEEMRPDLLDGGDGDELTMENLQEWYPIASGRSKEDDDFRDRARNATQALQAGDARYLALWERIVAVSKASLRRDYGRLGCEFTYFYGESRYQDMLGPIVSKLEDSGEAELSEGAIVVHLKEGKKLPPLMLRNSKGGYGYGATDLATIVDRVETDDPEFILYVVDARQKMHFQQVFLAAKQTGLNGRAVLEHTAFGTVNGTDGKPFKTREGGVMRLHDLMEEMHAAARMRLDEMDKIDASLREETAEQIAIAAIKFGELSHDRESNYIFDMDQFLQFEGKTGPYIQYTCVRIASLMDNAKAAGLEAGAFDQVSDNARALVLVMDEFPAKLERSVETRKPSNMALHVYNLANATNSFYQSNRVLAEGIDPAVAASHLGLLAAAKAQLELGLGLLGIEVPAKM
ncbi:arginine--tRNA ligase [Lentibacter algarum]|uniref:arginine--tRNA ligase n=1 Tax=Lentibacter algarum TaxID=576131 RepID=UPI001C070474|nr:arginine--tRNA ligase [Lentibacter algarum]MBU2981006.1 arginine--tRNA ligase [Lentibacter algarum]